MFLRAYTISTGSKNAPDKGAKKDVNALKRATSISTQQHETSYMMEMEVYQCP